MRENINDIIGRVGYFSVTHLILSDLLDSVPSLRLWGQGVGMDEVRLAISSSKESLGHYDESVCLDWDHAVGKTVAIIVELHPELALPVEDYLISQLAERGPLRLAALRGLDEVSGPNFTYQNFEERLSRITFLLDDLGSLTEKEAMILVFILSSAKEPQRQEFLRIVWERMPSEWEEVREEVALNKERYLS